MHRLDGYLHVNEGIGDDAGLISYNSQQYNAIGYYICIINLIATKRLLWLLQTQKPRLYGVSMAYTRNALP